MKRIYLGDADKAKIMAQIEASLIKGRGGKVSLTYDTNTLPRHAGFISPHVMFTATAFAKMAALLMCTTTEIGWRGVVDYLPPDEEHQYDRYRVSDILTFPQTVGAATYDQTEDGSYEKWDSELPDDIYNRLTLHGHSHVNMGAFSSGKDDGVQEGFIKAFDKNTRFIFMVANKNLAIWLNIYDMPANVMYEDDDCVWCIETENGEIAYIDDWYDDQIAKNVTPYKKPTTSTTTYGYKYNSGGWASDYNDKNTTSQSKQETFFKDEIIVIDKKADLYWNATKCEYCDKNGKPTDDDIGDSYFDKQFI